MNVRETVWRWVRSGVPVGQILPWWCVAVRCCLFPLDSFYWWYSKQAGYDLIQDVWVLHGVRCSGAMLRELFNSDGQVFYIKRDGDVLYVTELAVRGRAEDLMEVQP
jgi:hypothetical protein